MNSTKGMIVLKYCNFVFYGVYQKNIHCIISE